MFYETLLHITNPKTYIIVKKSIYFFDIFAINNPSRMQEEYLNQKVGFNGYSNTRQLNLNFFG